MGDRGWRGKVEKTVEDVRGVLRQKSEYCSYWGRWGAMGGIGMAWMAVNSPLGGLFASG